MCLSNGKGCIPNFTIYMTCVYRIQGSKEQHIHRLNTLMLEHGQNVVLMKGHIVPLSEHSHEQSLAEGTGNVLPGRRTKGKETKCLNSPLRNCTMGGIRTTGGLTASLLLDCFAVSPLTVTVGDYSPCWTVVYLYYCFLSLLLFTKSVVRTIARDDS